MHECAHSEHFVSLDSVYGIVMTKSHGRGLQYVISLKGRARQPLEFYMNGETSYFLPFLVHTLFLSCRLVSVQIYLDLAP
jgi:hypothetical protein